MSEMNKVDKVLGKKLIIRAKKMSRRTRMVLCTLRKKDIFHTIIKITILRSNISI